MPSHARLLVVDDVQDNARLIALILENAGYEQILTVTDSREVLDHVRQFAPDLIVLDLMMAEMSGYDILAALPQVVPVDSFLPVLVVTADGSLESRQKALSLGATDFLLRPHEVFDLTLRVRNLLQTRFLHLEVMARNHNLEAQVLDRTIHLENSQAELKLAQLDVIARLALVGEHHDDDTGAHTRRVARTSRLIGQKLGLESDDVELIRRAAPLHDVGKIGISDTILRKNGKLTPEEFDIMKTHCEVGAQILSEGRSEMMSVARTIALSHHERWDGSGYPFGLSQDKIPLEGRIVTIADVFDALTHDRPYKRAWPVETAVDEIRRQSGRQFDPVIVDVFCKMPHEDMVHGGDEK